jgi:hypothetical protein
MRSPLYADRSMRRTGVTRHPMQRGARARRQATRLVLVAAVASFGIAASRDASGDERQALDRLFAVEEPAAVARSVNAELGAEVIAAASDGDAIRAALGSLRAVGSGAVFVRTDAGIGVAALASLASPRGDGAGNETLAALAERRTRVAAHLAAKLEIVKLLDGTSETARLELARQRRMLDDAEADVTASVEDSRSVVAGFLAGASLFGVAVDGGVVRVAVISTPRTQGVSSAIGADLLAARDLEAAKQRVRDEVQGGAAPPDGGTFVTLAEQELMACIAWGSAVRRSVDRDTDPRVAAEIDVAAHEAARRRAGQALLALLAGESLDAEGGTREEYPPLASRVAAELAERRSPNEAAAAKAHEELVATARSHDMLRSSLEGHLPPGVQYEGPIYTEDSRFVAFLAFLALDAQALAQSTAWAPSRRARPLGDTARRSREYPVAPDGSFQLTADGRLLPRSRGVGRVTSKDDL